MEPAIPVNHGSDLYTTRSVVTLEPTQLPQLGEEFVLQIADAISTLGETRSWREQLDF